MEFDIPINIEPELIMASAVNVPAVWSDCSMMGISAYATACFSLYFSGC